MIPFNGKLILLILLLLPLACSRSADQGSSTEVYRFSAENQLDIPVSNAAVTVDLSMFDKPPVHCRYVLYLAGAEAGSGQEIPSQCDDLTGNGTPEELFFLVDFEAGQTLDFELARVDETPHYEHKTQAFLKVQTGGSFEDGLYAGGTGTEKVNNIDIPNEQVQETGWAHMEGPVWESDLVGYRFYLDDRNRVDIFGKSMPDMVLDTITQNYHEIHPWGTDVLKVGQSLGLGSLAAVNNGDVQTINNWSARRFEVPVDGPLRSIIRMTYRDWELFGQTITAISEIEIHAGNRYTEQRVSLSGNTNYFTLATGIVKHENAPELKSGHMYNSIYGWTSGIQSDQGHGLDMGIVVPMAYQPQFRDDDPHTHLYTFMPVDGKAAYRYTSAWELDHDVTADFEAHVQQTAGLLTMPPRVFHR